MVMHDTTRRRARKRIDRRRFIEVTAAGGLALAGCDRRKGAPWDVSSLAIGPERAPTGPTLRAGLVGCGRRGTEAALDFLDAGPRVELVALADLFEDQLERCRARLSESRRVDIPEERRFTGVDGYLPLLEVDLDIAIDATPPHFRPKHLEAFIRARKHAWVEMPLAVDPVGVRSILASSERADALGLSVVAASEFRRKRSVVETLRRVRQGAIGEVVWADGWRSGRAFDRHESPDGSSEAESMIRDWESWCWLSGDAIVARDVHSLDLLALFSGRRPVKAMGVGGRIRRNVGDGYDFFAVDFTCADGVHMASRCSWIDGYPVGVSHRIVGTGGSTNGHGTIFDPVGRVAWMYEGSDRHPVGKQAQIDLIAAIRNGEAINDLPAGADATLSAIMGRESAYAGLEVFREELMESDLQLGSSDAYSVPEPGRL